MAGTYEAETASRLLRQSAVEADDRSRLWHAAVDRSPVTRAGLIVNPHSGKSSGKSAVDKLAG